MGVSMCTLSKWKARLQDLRCSGKLNLAVGMRF